MDHAAGSRRCRPGRGRRRPGREDGCRETNQVVWLASLIYPIPRRLSSPLCSSSSVLVGAAPGLSPQGASRRRVASAEHADHGIGELVTNDERPAGPVRRADDAALVIADGTVAWTGPASQAPAATPWWTRAAGPCCRGSPTRTPTWSSPGSAAWSSPPGCGGPTGRRHPGHGRGDPRRPRRRAAREPAAAGRRDAPPGHDHARVQVRVRADRPGRGRGLALAAEVTPRSPTSARTSCRRVRRRPGGYVDLVCGPMLDACAPSARWSTCSARTGRSARTRPPRCSPRAGPRAWAPACTPTSWPGPGVRAAAEAGAASADHCTFLTDADVEALTSAPVVATLLPARSSAPGSRSRRAPAAQTRAPRWPWPPTATRVPLHVQHAVLHRARGPRDGDDHRRGGLGRYRGRARALRRTTSAISASAPGPT